MTYDCDIYITGSNSNLLSSDLATQIAGRYVAFTIYPFSFVEFKKIIKALKTICVMVVCLTLISWAMFQKLFEFI